MTNIKVTNKYLSFDGDSKEALDFIFEIRDAYDVSGTDMSKALNDFIFAIEVSLQNKGILDEDFNKN